MLQRLASGDVRYGQWTRQELEVMDACFTGRVEAAFRAGLESRSAATASVRVGKPRVTEERVIEAAWTWLWEKNGDLAFSEIVTFVRARCPNVTASRVQAEFKKLFVRDGFWKETPMVTGERLKEQNRTRGGERFRVSGFRISGRW